MKPVRVSLFILCCILIAVLLGVAFSHAWRIWKTRSVEEKLSLSGYRASPQAGLTTTPTPTEAPIPVPEITPSAEETPTFAPTQ